jgi:hypothetical protein
MSFMHVLVSVKQNSFISHSLPTAMVIATSIPNQPGHAVAKMLYNVIPVLPDGLYQSLYCSCILDSSKSTEFSLRNSNTHCLNAT